MRSSPAKNGLKGPKKIIGLKIYLSSIYLKLFGCVCMFVPLWRSQFFTDPAHFWHVRPLGQQEGHRLCKVAL